MGELYPRRHGSFSFPFNISIHRWDMWASQTQITMEILAARHFRSGDSQSLVSEPRHVHSHESVSWVIFLWAKVRTPGLKLDCVSKFTVFCLLQVCILREGGALVNFCSSLKLHRFPWLWRMLNDHQAACHADAHMNTLIDLHSTRHLHQMMLLQGDPCTAEDELETQRQTWRPAKPLRRERQDALVSMETRWLLLTFGPGNSLELWEARQSYCLCQEQRAECGGRDEPSASLGCLSWAARELRKKFSSQKNKIKMNQAEEMEV